MNYDYVNISNIVASTQMAMNLADQQRQLHQSLADLLTINNNCCISLIEKPKQVIKIEGNCPSCGAPITGEKCEYCGRVHYLRI